MLREVFSKHKGMGSRMHLLYELVEIIFGASCIEVQGKVGWALVGLRQ